MKGRAEPGTGTININQQFCFGIDIKPLIIHRAIGCSLWMIRGLSGSVISLCITYYLTLPKIIWAMGCRHSRKSINIKHEQTFKIR